MIRLGFMAQIQLSCLSIENWVKIPISKLSLCNSAVVLGGLPVAYCCLEMLNFVEIHSKDSANQVLRIGFGVH